MSLYTDPWTAPHDTDSSGDSRGQRACGQSQTDGRTSVDGGPPADIRDRLHPVTEPAIEPAISQTRLSPASLGDRAGLRLTGHRVPPRLRSGAISAIGGSWDVGSTAFHRDVLPHVSAATQSRCHLRPRRTRGGHLQSGAIEGRTRARWWRRWRRWSYRRIAAGLSSVTRTYRTTRSAAAAVSPDSGATDTIAARSDRLLSGDSGRAAAGYRAPLSERL